MTPTSWYLVKRNWPQTEARCPTYAGLGGNLWPLEQTQGAEAMRLHSRMEESRKHVQIGHYDELVCTDLGIAEEYFGAVSRNLGPAWLLQAAPGELALTQAAGIDLGFPAGGFSVIETELITQALAGPRLNEWGLIASLPEALAYLEAREENEELEELDGVLPLSIRIIRRS